MENNRNHLKIASAIILLFTALNFLRTAGGFVIGNLAMLPDDTSKRVVFFVRILLVVVTFVFMLPQLYVGVRGLRIAKNPCATKGHIVWAWILLVLAVIGLFENIASLVQQGALLSKCYSLILVLLSIASYLYYIVFAQAIAKEK